MRIMWSQVKEIVIDAINNDNHYIRECGTWILTELARADGNKEDMWRRPKVSTPLLEMCRNHAAEPSRSKCCRHALLTLSMLSENRDVKRIMVDSPDAIATIMSMCQPSVSVDEYRELALRTLANLTDGDDDLRERIWKLPGIVEVLCGANNLFRTEALRALANLAESECNKERMWETHDVREKIISGSRRRRDQESRAHALRALSQLLDNESNRRNMWENERILEGVVCGWSLRHKRDEKACLKYALYVLGNAAAESANCDRLWGYRGVQDMLQNVLLSGLDSRSQHSREAAVSVFWIYANLAEGSENVREELYNNRCDCRMLVLVNQHIP